MARVTVEDCLEVVDNQYDLVILAKERTLQVGAGDQPMVPEDNDKKTVLSLREIGDKFLNQEIKRTFRVDISFLAKEQSLGSDPSLLT